jgi:hypothetical protein
MEKRDGFYMKQLVYINFLLPLLILGQGKAYMDESFDPTTLHDWGNSKVRIEQIKSLKDYYESLGEETDSVKVEDFSEFVFRVQLASTKDHEVAQAIEEAAVLAFDDEVIMQFDSPYYKIRLGKMSNREDAQSLQNIAIQNGYRRAWIIRTANTPALEN